MFNKVFESFSIWLAHAQPGPAETGKGNPMEVGFRSQQTHLLPLDYPHLSLLPTHVDMLHTC